MKRFLLYKEEDENEKGKEKEVKKCLNSDAREKA
jgi:hypothetical protein